MNEREQEQRRRSGAGRGFTLGALNVLVVAIVIAAYNNASWHTDGGGIVLLVCVYGGIPGVILGTILGAIAARIASRPPLVRVAVLAPPAVGLVFLLGRAFGVEELIVPASIPTFFAVWLLERATRARVEPPVPDARVL